MLIVISSTKNSDAMSRDAKLASILSDLSIPRLPFGMVLYSLDFKLSVYVLRSRYSALYCIHIEQNFMPGYTVVILSSSIIVPYAILKCEVNITDVEKLTETKIDMNKKLICFYPILLIIKFIKFGYIY